MAGRYFEHLYCEISTAAARRVSRFDLWLRIHEVGGDPDALTRRQVRLFVDQQLGGLLSEEGIRLEGRQRRRLEFSLLDFDPDHPTPAEWLAGV